jgi:hypothetical protein
LAREIRLEHNLRLFILVYIFHLIVAKKRFLYYYLSLFPNPSKHDFDHEIARILRLQAVAPLSNMEETSAFLNSINNMRMAIADQTQRHLASHALHSLPSLTCL